jgi:hypothetical protein
MRQRYSWSSVGAQVAQAIEVWNGSAVPSALHGPQYSLKDQKLREKAYDEGLADACLARGWLDAEESHFSFEWGMLLQLGDGLQDVREDKERGSTTLFSRAATLGRAAG